MKNLFDLFINWYIENREGKTSNYIGLQFRGKDEKFREAVKEYASEFENVFDYNPFEITVTSSLINQMHSDIYLKDTPFEQYSKRKSNHMPKAILGKNNYLRFISEYLQDVNIAKTENPEKTKNPKGKIIYTRDELYARFTHRIITQDRCYGDVYFPISILKKLFYQQSDSKAFFKNWIEKTLDDIIVHTKNDEVTLNKVEKLMIDTTGVGSVHVLLSGSGNLERLYTRNADGSEKTPLEQSLLRDIVLDHVEPMSRILINNSDKLPALKSLTTEINKKHCKRKSIVSGDFKSIGASLLDLQIIDHSHTANLKKELELIQKYTKIELMDRVENSKKSDN